MGVPLEIHEVPAAGELEQVHAVDERQVDGDSPEEGDQVVAGEEVVAGLGEDPAAGWGRERGNGVGIDPDTGGAGEGKGQGTAGIDPDLDVGPRKQVLVHTVEHLEVQIVVPGQTPVGPVDEFHSESTLDRAGPAPTSSTCGRRRRGRFVVTG